jgi:hypothetical protein
MRVDTGSTYVEKKQIANTDIEITQLDLNAELKLVDAETECGETVSGDASGEIEFDKDNGDSGSGTGENFIHIQSLGFEIGLPYKENPSDRTCEVFGNATMMSYTLKLKNGRDQMFTLSPVEAVTNDDGSGGGSVVLKFRWSQDMGIMADSEWQGATSCLLTGKTGSGFIYKLSWFTLKWSDSSQSGYDPGTKTSEWDADTINYTNVQILS